MSRVLPLLLLILSALPAPPAGAASKVLVAAIGDAAPGGGQFAGPGFTGAPSAAGEGWVAFRSEVAGGGTTEALVASRLTGVQTSIQVASVGQKVGGGEPCAGTLRQFVGRPVVNARGDVAFLAVVNPKNPPPAAPDGTAPFIEPSPAGVFLYRDGRVRVLACGGQTTDLGTLDLLLTVDPQADNPGETVERSPALNDAGDVAFLAALLDAGGYPSGGAIFTASATGAPTAAVRIGDPFEGGTIQTLGPPALNNGGTLAFHAVATTTAPAEADGRVDGIFLATAGGVAAIVRAGLAPVAGTPLLRFEDAVALNDVGDVAFLAGPFRDGDTVDDPTDAAPGVLLWRHGAVTLIARPGQRLGDDDVTALALSGAVGGGVVPPQLTADGRVIFLASLNGGSAETIYAWSESTGVRPQLVTAGTGAAGTPVGGRYAGVQSPPAADALGGLAFVARVVGGATSEALFFHPASGTATPVVVGDATPASGGFYAGKPFGVPAMNDAGDVVFRAFVARGPASVGIYRWRDGGLTPVVRAGDPSPNVGRPPFLDLVGEPSIDDAGRVAFTGVVDGIGRGVYVADAAGIHTVAVRKDVAPGDAGTTFAAIAQNPSIDRRAGVAFRATTQLRNDATGITVKRDGLFLADPKGIHALLFADDPSPSGLPYLRMRDPALTAVPSVAFRATLDAGAASDADDPDALLLTGPDGTTALVARDDVLPGGELVTGFTGNASASAAGHVGFVVLQQRDAPAGVVAGPAVVRRLGAALDVVARAGDTVAGGGELRRLGQPAINDDGVTAFRASFVKGTGGTGGLYLGTPDGVRPFVLQQEGTPLGGRYASFGSRVSLNVQGEVAFSGTVSQGRARSGLFVAYPTVLVPHEVTLRASRRLDRLRVAAALTLGRGNDGVDPAKEAITFALRDARGPIWSATVPARRLRKVRRSFRVRAARGTPLEDVLSSARVTPLDATHVLVRAVSARAPFTRRRTRRFEAPFTLSVELGDDSGSATFDCPAGFDGIACAF
jgi:hypothetical protein